MTSGGKGLRVELSTERELTSSYRARLHELVSTPSHFEKTTRIYDILSECGCARGICSPLPYHLFAIIYLTVLTRRVVNGLLCSLWGSAIVVSDSSTCTTKGRAWLATCRTFGHLLALDQTIFCSCLTSARAILRRRLNDDIYTSSSRLLLGVR